MPQARTRHWFSTKIRFVCLVESRGVVRPMDAVLVLQSPDFQTAFHKALALGVCQERAYRNADQHQVRWRLMTVLSLAMLLAESLDGAEVYAEPVPLAPGETWSFETIFHPKLAEPTQTLRTVWPPMLMYYVKKPPRLRKFA